MATKNKMVLTKKIERVFQTAQFESIKVLVGFEEEIQWENEKDKTEQIDQFTDNLVDELIKTISTVTMKMNLPNKVEASKSVPAEIKAEVKKEKPKVKVEEPDPLEGCDVFDGLDLKV
jgi:hypothetical protein